MKRNLLLIGFVFVQWILSSQVVNEIQRIVSADIDIGDVFGSALAISGDYAIIGACYDDENGSNSGSAYIFYNNLGVWEQEYKIIPPNGQANDFFALTVAMAGDYVFILVLGENNYTGSVDVYLKEGSEWNFVQKLEASDAAEWDFFGYVMEATDEHIIIGAYGNDDGGEEVGSAYVFKNNDGVWEEQIKIVPEDGEASDQFGKSVGIFGDNVIIGSPGNKNSGVATGSAYIYTNNAENWEFNQKLVPNDATLGDHIGSAVSISENIALVGADYKSENGTWSGVAYLFQNDFGAWNETTKLTASAASEFQHFGSSVHIDGQNIVIGAEGSTSFTPYIQGSAYVFHNDNGTWNEKAILSSSDNTPIDLFGFLVDLSNEFIIVSAPRNDTDGEDAGAVYIFDTFAPTIINQPQSQVFINSGSSVSISVLAEGTNLTYQWRKGGVDMVNTTNILGVNTNELSIIAATVIDEGNYNCYIAGEYGNALSDTAILSVLTGINSHQKFNCKIYPNPTKEILYIEGKNMQKIELFNSNGKILLVKNSKYQKENIDLRKFSAGVYVLKIVTLEEVYFESVIIK